MSGECVHARRERACLLRVVSSSSPGVERKLLKYKDFERFIGKKIKAVLREPVENSRRWEGTLALCADGLIHLEVAEGKTILFPFDQVEKANLKFEWGTRTN